VRAAALTPGAVLTLDADAAGPRARLTDHLAATGALHDPAWERALARAPRHAFVPEFHQREGFDRWRTVTRDSPDYLGGVYADLPLTTQLTGGVPTSSSSQPSLMVMMLEALGLRDGSRVLEVATGTGWNAALLCERLGDDRVTTVEVDPVLADLARARLAALGHAPAVVTGDGRAGHRPGAPYDALIATCGFLRIPDAWPEQLRPGGVIVCPVGWGNVRLVVADGGRAEGRFLPMGSYFMPVREAGATGSVPEPEPPEHPDERPAVLGPAGPFGDDSFDFLLSLAVPGVRFATERGPGGAVSARRAWQADGSWARVAHGRVRQAGPFRLWDAVESAHAHWTGHGRPARQRFGLSVAPGRQRVWLDTQDGPSWPL
jgi:protein-L-isoaspartate O-methyltransferase